MTPEERAKAQALESDGDLAGALKVYREAYLKSDKDEDAILGIAQCAMMLDDLGIAMEFFVKLLIVNHENPWGYLGRGMIMMENARSTRALSDIRKALKLDNPPTEMRIDAAAALNDYGFSEEAIEALMPLRDTHYNDPDFRAEWVFGLLIIEDMNNQDILNIISEELEKADTEDKPEPYYHLCNYARMYKTGRFTAVRELAKALLSTAPELTDRAHLLGLV